MFSRLPVDTLGAQAESASEAMITVVKAIKCTLGKIPAEDGVWSNLFIQELLTVIFTVYQSTCLAIYIRHDDLVAFDELA